jgi:phosphatidylinositol glycan class A protein
MDSPSMKTKQHRIAMVCDFFYPRLGGVENHIWSLSQHLLRQGHKVIVITHAYGNRKGVRYMSDNLKVYYCPFVSMVDADSCPTFTASLPLLRWILIREGIQIIHSHQATSTMANEAIVYASRLGIASVYTDHSLFGFDDLASVVLNRVLQTTLSQVDAAICVSHTCRDNLILRARLDPSCVRVIPNAVDPSKFTPDPSQRSSNRYVIPLPTKFD